MNPSLIPTPDLVPLPAPVWLLQFLLVLTFVLHLIPMNFALGGTLMAALAALRGRSCASERRLSKVLFGVLPSVTAIAINLGVAPLLFLQLVYGQFFYTSSVLMAWFWLAVIPILIAGYYGTYLCALKAERLGRFTGVVAVFSLLCFATIAVLYVMNMNLMLHPARWEGMLATSGTGLNLNLSDPVILPRLLHFAAGAMAIAGLGVAVLSRRHADDAEFAAWMRRRGISWFVHGTLANVLIGPWFLLSQPQDVLSLFTGGLSTSVVLLGAGILLAVVALMLVRQHLYLGFGAVVLTLALMSVVRHQVRLATLGDAFQPEQFAVSPQWGLFAIFAVFLVMGLSTVGWMARAYLRAVPKGGEETPSRPPAASR